MNYELTDEELLVASDEDWAFYNKIIEGLPTMAGKNGDGLDKFGVPIPYHSGPHIIRHIQKTIEIVKPNRILEIGFNMGHSASMWLNLSEAEVVSLDISRKDETLEGAICLYGKFSNRFTFLYREEFNKNTKLKFDLCFIDGGHEEEDVTADIQLAKDLKIPYILGDDFYKRFGPGVQKSFDKFPLELVHDMNNIKLYKWANN